MEKFFPKKLNNKKAILLGNEAIVRGALEVGVDFVSTYPGTPASEIGNEFARIARDFGVYFEFSTNEKVALEAGIGASFSGLKTLVAMKNFGLNVCLDSLLPFVYTGSKGPFVLVVADDPSCHSSAQSEENSRALAGLGHIPILEPSDPQECLDFTKLAFEISEKFKTPVMLRTTTRVAHQRAPVKFGEIKIRKSGFRKGKFIKDPKSFVTMPPRVLEMHQELIQKQEKIREFSEKSKINQISRYQSAANNCQLGIITSGVSYLYVREALKELNISLPVLKLGFFHPLAKRKIKDFLENFKKVLVVEELEPYLEKELVILAKDVNPKIQIFGKNLIPEVGELKPEQVIFAISEITKNQRSREFCNIARIAQMPIPKRFPQFCPGCPYWLVFQAIKKAVNIKKVVFGGDIGCYMLASVPPHNLYDYLSSMGSSIGIGHGIKKSTDQKLIAFIGDSTFIHAGIPALINAVFNKSNPLIIILDNQTTAMTGHQPHPGMAKRRDSQYKFSFSDPDFVKFSEGQPAVKLEEMVLACGVKNLKVIDPVNQTDLITTIKGFLEKDEVSVIIARRMCVLFSKSFKKDAKKN